MSCSLRMCKCDSSCHLCISLSQGLRRRKVDIIEDGICETSRSLTKVTTRLCQTKKQSEDWREEGAWGLEYGEGHGAAPHHVTVRLARVNLDPLIYLNEYCNAYVLYLVRFLRFLRYPCPCVDGLKCTSFFILYYCTALLKKIHYCVFALYMWLFSVSFFKDKLKIWLRTCLSWCVWGPIMKLSMYLLMAGNCWGCWCFWLGPGNSGCFLLSPHS